MGMIEDIRKAVQDLVAPDLKAIQEKIDHVDEASRLRDEALSAKIDSKFELVTAKMDAYQATIMNALNIDKRVEAIEREALIFKGRTYPSAPPAIEAGSKSLDDPNR